MERVITNELTRLLVFLGVGVAALTTLIASRIQKTKGSFRPYARPTLLYMLVALLFFSIVALSAHPALKVETGTLFIGLQVWFLGLGIAHYYGMHRYLQWTGEKGGFGLELLFSLVCCLFGAIGFVLLYRVVNREGLQWSMAAASLFFLLPLFFFQTFSKAMVIPPKIVQEWFYPVQQGIEDPEDGKLKNMLVISFEFRKQTADPHYTNFRAKAPVDMEFGQLFYFFINDYNERHPNGRIHFIGDTGEPHGWIFYKKPRWHTLITRYIDGGRTIFNNHIKEDDVIICERSLN
jgi:hypothetical protein